MPDQIEQPAGKTIPTDLGNKANAAMRYVASNVSGGLMLFVALGAMSPEQSATVIAQMHVMYQATQNFIGAFASIWYIIFPIVSGYLLKVGVNSSGFGVMMDKIFKAAQAGNKDAQVAIVSAAASPTIGTKAIINPMLASEAATPATVVANVSDLSPKTQGEVK
jgi:hypothetical protein